MEIFGLLIEGIKKLEGKCENYEKKIQELTEKLK